MHVKLVETLDKGNAKDIAAVENHKSDETLKLLLDNNAQEELNFLRSFNLDPSLAKVDALRSKTIQLEKVDGKSFHIKDLRKLAENYDLKLLPLELFRGSIDSLVAKKTVDFCKERNLEMSSVRHSNCLFVLAPYELFKLGSSKYVKPIVEFDPLLLYRDERNSDVYTLIHKWGNDFTFLRAFRGLHHKHALGHLAVDAIFFFLLASIVLSLILNTFIVNVNSFTVLNFTVMVTTIFSAFNARHVAKHKHSYKEFYFTKGLFNKSSKRTSDF